MSAPAPAAASAAAAAAKKKKSKKKKPAARADATAAAAAPAASASGAGKGVNTSSAAYQISMIDGATNTASASAAPNTSAATPSASTVASASVAGGSSDAKSLVPASSTAAAAGGDGLGYRLNESASKGRYLTAAREFTAGDVVLTDTAYAWVSHDPAICIACGKAQFTPSAADATDADAAGDDKKSTKKKNKSSKAAATTTAAAPAGGDIIAQKHALGAHRDSCAEYKRCYLDTGLHVLVENLSSISRQSHQLDEGRLRLATRIISMLALDASAATAGSGAKRVFPTAQQILAQNKPLSKEPAAASKDAKSDAKAAPAVASTAAAGSEFFDLFAKAGVASVWRIFGLHGCDRSVDIAKHRKAATHVVNSLRDIPAVPAVLREVLTDAVVVRLFDILSTNSHGMGSISGSGIFFLGAMAEHSCLPNCCFTPRVDHTNPSLPPQLSVHALDTIHVNTPLSISYSGSYEPTKLRQLQLRSVYGFDCACTLCTRMPDRCRAFFCPFDVECRKAGGLVSPFGTGLEAGSWACLRCRTSLDSATAQKYMSAEEMLSKLNPLDRDLKALLAPNQGVFHESHYLVFRAIEKQCEVLCARREPALAETLAIRLALNADRVLLPKYHPEKLTYYDMLAQTRIAQQTKDKTEKAALVYVRLYEMLKIMKGVTHPSTLRYRANALQPPTFVELLQQERDQSHASIHA